MAIALFIVSLALLLMLIILLLYLRQVRINRQKETDEMEEEDIRLNKISSIQQLVFTALAVDVLAILISIYLIVKGTLWEGHLMEWLNISVRLMHITFGIAWIGASFYFVFLENALNRSRNVRDELAGNLWAIHGGGFYYLEKYKVAPQKIPKHLHWFKYEAYFTWVTGICMLFIVYYFNASATMVSADVLKISGATAVGIALGSFVIAWFLYDLLCKSPLAKKPVLFAIVGLLLLAAFAYGYHKVFVGKAAFMHFGAMLGTIMAANVFMVIIPSQKAMVKFARLGKMPDEKIGKNAGRRSLHNNYFTLPVLFVMISNHFPVTFGNTHAWMVLMIITLGSMGVKHYLNITEQGKLSVWVLPASIIILLAAVFITAPPKTAGQCDSKIDITQVYAIVQKRCITCHSTKPTDKFYTTPPNGVVYDTPGDIIKVKDKILQRVVLTKSMPLNNQTGMTEAERDIIRCWIEQSP